MTWQAQLIREQQKLREQEEERVRKEEEERIRKEEEAERLKEEKVNIGLLSNAVFILILVFLTTTVLNGSRWIFSGVVGTDL